MGETNAKVLAIVDWVHIVHSCAQAVDFKLGKRY